MLKNTKKVNIYPRTPILTMNPVIRTTTLGVTMTYDQIRNCIMGRALVDEILSDGSTIRLTLGNYKEKNNPSVNEDEQLIIDGTNPVLKEDDEPDAAPKESPTNRNAIYTKKNKNKIKMHKNSVQTVPSGYKTEETAEFEEEEKDVTPTADETTEEEFVDVMDAENLNV